MTLPSTTYEHDDTDDREELGRLFTAHLRFVTAVARRVLGPDDADDGVQEVFLRLTAKPVSYRGQSAFRTWLYRVTVNTCLNMARARARRWDRSAPLSLVEHVPSRAHALLTSLELRAALATLSPIQRRVLLLHDWEGYKHSEVGRTLGIAEGTSKARLSKARLAVRRVMSEG